MSAMSTSNFYVNNKNCYVPPCTSIEYVRNEPLRSWYYSPLPAVVNHSAGGKKWLRSSRIPCISYKRFEWTSRHADKWAKWTQLEWTQSVCCDLQKARCTCSFELPSGGGEHWDKWSEKSNRSVHGISGNRGSLPSPPVFAVCHCASQLYPLNVHQVRSLLYLSALKSFCLGDSCRPSSETGPFLLMCNVCTPSKHNQYEWLQNVRGPPSCCWSKSGFTSLNPVSLRQSLLDCSPVAQVACPWKQSS